MRTFLALAGLIVAALVVAVTIAFLRPNSSSPMPGEEPPPAAPAPPPAKMMTFDEAKQGAVRVHIDVAGRGKIVMELYPKAAPKTVEHFLSLCQQHFYDGQLVHRVETSPKFRLFQTGDPASKGITPSMLQGKTGEQIASELHLGVGGSGTNVPLEARLPNVPNSVGLARSQSPDSGDSQFYVNLSNNGDLDGKYCVFGMVIEGQDVAAQIQVGDKITKISSP